MNTNNSAFSPNEIIPIIEFKEVPLDIALENLIRQSAVDIKIDPRITADYATFSIRWENITAKQAILALCNNYDLDIVKDATTGDLQIKPKPKAGKWVMVRFGVDGFLKLRLPKIFWHLHFPNPL